MLPHGRRSLALFSHYSRQQGAEDRFSCSHPTRLAHPHPQHQSQLYILPRGGAGPTVLVTAVCEGQGQLSLFMSLRLALLPAVGVRVGCGDGMFPSPMSSHDIPERGRGCFLAFISTGRLSWAPPASRVCSSVHLRHGVGTSLPSAPVAEGQGQFFLLLQQWGVGPILCSPIFSGLSGSRSRWLW